MKLRMKLYSKTQRLLYTIGYYLALPILLLRLLWKSRANPNYRSRWLERLGYLPQLNTGQDTIWLHAVSVGETLAAVPLIKALLQNYPHYRIVITSTTPTGSALVDKHFANQLVNVYLSFDLPDCLHRFLNSLKPKLGIIMETELWPNLLHACRYANIPLFLANARLSAKSMVGYQRISSLTQSMLQCLTQVASQAEMDGERFIELGLPRQKLLVTGNIKFDMQVPEDLIEQGNTLRKAWGHARPTLIAASTHAGEDEMILTAFTRLRQKIPNLMLILVPRHPERFDVVAHLCQAAYPTVRRSKQEIIRPETAILLGDTMGELMLFYAAADVAFVGGSLVPIGGHNLIEPAILGLPVLTGPHLHNFVDISQLLMSANAVEVVNDPNDLIERCLVLFQNPSLGKEMGIRGQEVIIKNRGALSRHLECIDQLL